MIAITESLRVELQAERQKSLELGHKLQNASIQKQTEEEVWVYLY